MIKDGVTDVICTPHFQSSATRRTLKQQKTNFFKLKQLVNKKKLNINIHLGHEIRYRDHLEPDYKNLTLANSKYILVEFNTISEDDIVGVVRKLINLGLKPIIAHVERYFYIDYNDLIEIRKNGALLQVNSSSITDEQGWFSSKDLINRMIKEELIDIIASDIHGINFRYHSVRLAYDYLIDKVDKNYLDKICYYNQINIIKGKNSL